MPGAPIRTFAPRPQGTFANVGVGPLASGGTNVKSAPLVRSGPLMSAGKPSLPMSGGCGCGAIRYEITSFPVLLWTCHCTDCQTASGSAFGMTMPVETSGFRIVKGEVKGWRHLSPSGVEVTTWFCGECGARIYGSRKTRPEFMNVRPGTLDDTKWLAPVLQIFTRSAQGWVKPADGAECFDEVPADFQP